MIDLTSDGEDDAVAMGTEAPTRAARRHRKPPTSDEHGADIDSSEDEAIPCLLDRLSSLIGKRSSARKQKQPLRDASNDRSRPKRQKAIAPSSDEESDSEFPHISARNSATAATTTTATPEERAAYLRSLTRGVAARAFPLEPVPARETVATGRTVKKMAGWNGLWPALREFLQNTIDHLCLLDQATGRRHRALDLDVEDEPQDGGGGATTTFTFRCGGEAVCVVRVCGPDELVIEQAYTFPLPARALDTGVPDTSKQGGECATAGDSWREFWQAR